MSKQTLNISENNIAGKCDLKCAYSYNYTESSCIVNNNINTLMMPYDKQNIAPVTYNGEKYQVTKVDIKHNISNIQFDGKVVDGLLSIEHNGSTDPSKTLLVLIPLLKGSGNAKSSIIVTDIISQTSNLAPKAGNKSLLKVDNFNLKYLIPKSGFYSYNLDDGKPVICYGRENGITLTGDTFDSLEKITKKGILVGVVNTALYYNSKGANTTTTGTDDIYIDCKPVDASQEQIDIDTSTSSFNIDKYKVGSVKTDYDFKDFLTRLINNKWFQYFLLILFMVILFYLVRYLIKSGDRKTIKTITAVEKGVK
jgi:hypothetical protein